MIIADEIKEKLANNRQVIEKQLVAHG